MKLALQCKWLVWLLLICMVGCSAPLLSTPTKAVPDAAPVAQSPTDNSVVADIPLPPTADSASQAGRQVRLPVLMYHSVLRSRQGVYIVSPAQFEQDLIALRDAGYTPVLSPQVVAYVLGWGTLPAKPIMITFDDGHYNNMYYAFPLLKQYNAKAVFSLVGSFSQYSTTSGDDSNPNYSHLTWQQAVELQQSGLVEIGNHTYAMHSYHPRFGLGRLPGESDAAYRQALRADWQRLEDCLQQAGGTRCRVFAYPFGKLDRTAQSELIAAGYTLLLTCNEGVTTLRQGDLGCLRAIKRINRSGRYSTQTVLDKIQTA